MNSLTIFLWLALSTIMSAAIPPEISHLIDKADSLLKGPRGRTLDEPVDAELKTALTADVHSNNNPLIIEILKTKNCNDASWQIAAGAIFSDYSPEVSLETRLKLYEEAFLVSIDPEKRSLDYFFPRGWSYPFRFRADLARDLYRLKTGERIFEIPQKELLYSNPKEWLVWLKDDNGPKTGAPVQQPPPEASTPEPTPPSELKGTIPQVGPIAVSSDHTTKIGKYRIGAAAAILLVVTLSLLIFWKCRKG